MVLVGAGGKALELAGGRLNAGQPPDAVGAVVAAVLVLLAVHAVAAAVLKALAVHTVAA